MLIQYTGPKEKKVVDLGQEGTYVFELTCEVKKPEAIKFLLDADRKGLFIEVKDEEPTKPELEPEPEKSRGPKLVKRKSSER